MANKPDDPRAPQDPDPQKKEPGKTDLGNPQTPAESDSAIDLGIPEEGVEKSGISVIEWASLAEENPASRSKVKIDSPSDADLRAQARADAPEPLPEAVAELPAEPTSVVDLGKQPRAEDEAEFAELITDSGIDLADAQPVKTGESSAIDLGEAVAVEESVPVASTSDSAIDFGADIQVVEESVEQPASASAIELPPDAIVEEAVEVAEAEEFARAADSGIDLGGKHAAFHPPSESGIDLADVVPATEGGSGVPRLAPGESGIDLVAEDAVIEEPVPAAEVQEAAEAADAVEAADVLTPADSGVDLSPRAEVPPAPGDSGIDLGDLDAFAEGGSKESKLAPGESGMKLIAEDVILEEPAAPASGSGSSRDLIAEELESGLDLLDENIPKAEVREAEASQQDKESEDALDDFLAQVGTEDPSSSVDLGSAHTINVFQEEDYEAAEREALASDSGVPAAELEVTEVTEEAIDLDVFAGPAAEDAAKKGHKVAAADSPETEAIDLDMGALAEDPPAQEPAEEAVDLGALAGPADIEEEAPRKGKKKAVAGPVEEEEVAAVEEDEPKPKKKKKAEDEEEEKPKKEKKRGRAGAWLGGMFLGGLMSAAACAGVWLFAEPPREWKTTVYETVGMEAPKDDARGKGKQDDKQPPAVTFAQTADRIRSGDLDKVKEADLAGLDANDPAQLVARAEYAWLNYLKTQRGRDLKPDAEPVKKALADLNAAVDKGSADGLFLRGQIQEMTGNPKGALADYRAGAEKFKADAEQRERFEAAIVAMELGQKTAALPRPLSPRLLALVLIHLQAVQPPGGDQPAQKAPDEAGFRFWQAIKAVREARVTPAEAQKKYAEALKLLDEARSRHDARRFVMLRKAQNPLSDPREEIFLRACDELREYWALRARLGNPNYLAGEDRDRDPAVDAIVKKADDAARAAQLKELGDKLFKDKPVAKPEDLLKLVADERKDLGDKITGLEKNVDDQKKAITKLEDEKKDVSDRLKTATADLEASSKREKDLKASVEEANKALADVGKVVKVDFKDAKASGAGLVKEVSEVHRISQMKDPTGTIRKLEGELAVDRARLKERWEPAEMLPVWLSILESDRSRTDLHPSIEKDLRRVEADTSSKGVDKARAQALRGLMLRNEEKFNDSAETLKKAKAGLDDARSQWGKVVDAALTEVSDPAGTYARRTEELLARNKQAEALATLKKGLEVVPDKKGVLYARRAQIAIDSAKSRGAGDEDDPPLKEDDPAVKAAKQDAELAAKEGLAEGHYQLGRIAEETGKVPEAVKAYKAAVDAHKEKDEAGARYRVALARALLKARAGEVAPVRPAPPADRTGKAAPKKGEKEKGEKARQATSVELLSLLVTLLQAPALPKEGENVREAEKLADEILALGDKASFDSRATALAVKGLYTRALNTYLKGLREKGLLAPGYANALLELVKDHPAMKRPGSLSVPDYTAGEKAYASGLGFFAKKQYVEAEREFLSAVENDNGDARYYYYLGLARLAQGKRDANEDFDAAARLERLGRPDRATVSQALERVQGPMRKALNDVRYRPAKDRPK